MARIRWTPQALEDIDSICSYIARDSPHFASIFALDVYEAVDILEASPLAGRRVPEISRNDVREIILGNYRIVYQVGGEVVIIITIYHGARSLDLRKIAHLLKG